MAGLSISSGGLPPDEPYPPVRADSVELSLGRRQSMNSSELKELLRATTAFSILSDRELDHLADRFELIHFALGQDLVHAGDEAKAFFIVYSGRARVIAIDKTGQEATVGTLTRGDSFGEQGLLTRSQRNYTIRASSDRQPVQLYHLVIRFCSISYSFFITETPSLV